MSTLNHTNIDGTTTTTTASVTQLSSSEFNSTHNGDITSSTTTASCTGCQAPLTITTIIDGSDLINDGIFPLEMLSKLATTFPFTSPSKNAQNSSHNRDGDGDVDFMSVVLHFLFGQHPFNHHLNKMQIYKYTNREFVK